mgnify:FL=1
MESVQIIAVVVFVVAMVAIMSEKVHRSLDIDAVPPWQAAVLQRGCNEGTPSERPRFVFSAICKDGLRVISGIR